LHIVPRIRYLGFTTRGKKGPLTTTGDLPACKSQTNFDTTFNRQHWAPELVPESSRSFPLLHVGPCCQFLSELDEAPCHTRFGPFLTGSSEFVMFSGLVPGLLGVMFTSLHDLYRASWSCHKVLDELIPDVLLSTLKLCINTKLQFRHG
jgi:hypothetical protein